MKRSKRASRNRERDYRMAKYLREVERYLRAQERTVSKKQASE